MFKKYIFIGSILILAVFCLAFAGFNVLKAQEQEPASSTNVPSCTSFWSHSNSDNVCKSVSYCGAYMWQYFSSDNFSTQAKCEEDLAQKSCAKDSDCVCGLDIITGANCFYGNAKYTSTDTEKLCSDYCTGWGKMVVKCIAGKCRQVTSGCRDENSGCAIEDNCCEGLKAVSYAFPEGGSCIAASCGSICRPCGNGVCDSSENTCNCPEDCKASGKPPVIDSFSAPTQLNVNQIGTWTIKAHDPETGSLSYSVSWGDEKSEKTASLQADLASAIQTSTFTHAYSGAGTYTVQFTVTDDQNLTAKSSTTISVIASSSTCKPDYNSGSCCTGNICVASAAALPGTICNFKGCDSACSPVWDCGQACDQKCKSFGHEAGICQSFAVSPEGFKQKELVEQKYDSIGETSDCYQPKGLYGSTRGCYCAPKKLVLTYPNGEEGFYAGETYSITWKSTGIKTVSIYLDDVKYEGGVTEEIACLADAPCASGTTYCGPCLNSIASNITASLGKYSWTIPAASKMTKAKIFIEADNVLPKVNDKSDNHFNVKPKSCYGEGELMPVLPDVKCCAGLTAISNAEYVSPTANTPENCIAAQGSMICAKCGDGICGKGENYCNCSKDCPAKKSLSVISPNGGESWQAGKTHEIKWAKSGFSDTDKINIQLVNYEYGLKCAPRILSPNESVSEYLKCGPFVYKIASDIPINKGVYSWIVPTTISQSKTYKIRIETPITGVAYAEQYKIASSATTIEPYTPPSVYYSDESDNYFGIVKACAGEGEFCGGFAGISCCSGLNCQYEDNYPDAGGKCVKPTPTCSDSDGGKDYYTKGTVSKCDVAIGGATACGISVDTCLKGVDPFTGGAYLTEYYCENDQVKSTTYTCPGSCQDGACIGKTNCSKSSDCYASCSHGCVNKNWYNSNVKIDCEAYPDYTCECKEGICQAAKRSLTLVSPNGGEKWMTGKTYNITWKSTGINKVNLYFTDSNLVCSLMPCMEGTCCGLCGHLIAKDVSASLGKYSWTIPASYGSISHSTVAIQEAVSSGNCLSDSSDSAFAIIKAECKKDSDCPQVDCSSLATDCYGVVYKCVDGKCVETSTCTDSDGGKDYYEKGKTCLGNDCKIDECLIAKCGVDEKCIGVSPQIKEYYCEGNEIKSITYSCPSGFTCEDGACAKETKQSLSLISPNGDERFYAGEAYNITWKSTGIKTVSIYLDDVQYEGGVTSELACVSSPLCASQYCSPCLEVVASNITASSGKYSWTIPVSSKMTRAKVLIEADNILPRINDKSDNYFYVRIKSCYEEGDLMPVLPETKCCVGLTAIANATYTPATVNTPEMCIASQGSMICAKCGDGVCGKGENYCSCPKDCKKSKYPDGTLIKFSDNQKIYQIVGGKKLWIPSIKVFNDLGLDWSKIKSLTKKEAEGIPDAQLIRAKGSPEVFILSSTGYKRHIPSPQVFESYKFKWSDVIDIDPVWVRAFPDALLIQLEGDYRVYKLENNVKRWIKTSQALEKLGYDWQMISTINKTEFEFYKEGTPLE